MDNCKEWFYVVITLIGLILFLVAMFMNYNLKLDRNQVKLAKEVKDIERVNGKEKADIRELQEAYKASVGITNSLQKEVQKLKKKYEKH